MVNYENGIIYKLCSKDFTDKNIYIGSTCNFNERKRLHKNDCNNITRNHLKVYKYINDHGGWDEWDMVFIDYAPCKSKMELCKIERNHQDKNENCTLNTIRAYITCDEKKERIIENAKKRYQQNKEYIQEQNMEYEKQNKERIKERKRLYYQQNKERLIELNKQHYKQNKERIKEQKRLYYHQNKERLKQERITKNG